MGNKPSLVMNVIICTTVAASVVVLVATSPLIATIAVVDYLTVAYRFRKNTSVPPSRLPGGNLIKNVIRIGMNCTNHYNIAIVGASGSGKSSIVNGLLGLMDKDAGAAKTGVTETTSNAKRYKHPNNENVILWDLPGGGTPKHPAETYFSDKFLGAFSALLVVTGERFLKLDLDILIEAKSSNVPVFFVRNKADQGIDGILDSDPEMSWAEAAKELKEKVEANFREQMEKADLWPQPLYVISARKLRSFVRVLAGKYQPEKLELIDEARLVDDISCAMHSW